LTQEAPTSDGRTYGANKLDVDHLVRKWRDRMPPPLDDVDIRRHSEHMSQEANVENAVREPAQGRNLNSLRQDGFVEQDL